MECWTYGQDAEGRTPSPFIRYEIKDFDIAPTKSWLREDFPSRDGQRPSSGFRLLLISCGDAALDPRLTRDEKNRLHIAVGIPAFLSHHGSSANGGCGMFSQCDGSYGTSLGLPSEVSLLTVPEFSSFDEIATGRRHLQPSDTTQKQM